MISKETIEAVLMRTDITTLIGGYVSLKRAGSNLKGLCPFHSEKTPSFTVYPSASSFYCFGCGAGGDAITFIRKRENLDYPDAIAFLAQRAGITIVEDDRSQIAAMPKFDRKKFYSMNVDAAKFFNRCLFSDQSDSKAALAYFTEKRGLSMATIKHFGLGYAPDNFDSFLKYMLAKGYTHDELVAGFLCGKSEKGAYYPSFRNRVMFPIIDVSGNVIAFGGRAMDGNSAKYKNSSDTPVFKKSRNLFALNFARHHCAETLVLCEGYMDVIAMHAAGFENAVATLGTAITSEQARIISRYTKKVVISYDADEAGQKAAMRAVKMLTEVGLDVSILRIPGAKDPDEYIKKYGADKFRQVLDQSKSKFDYSLENILSKYDINLPQDKIKALHECEKLISETYSSAERDIYIHVIAQIFGVEARSIKTDVDSIVSRAVSERRKEESSKVKQDAVGYSDRVNPDYIKAPAVAKNEETLLGLLLLYPEHRKKVFEEGLVDESDFFTEFNRRIFVYLKKAYFEGDDSHLDMDACFTPDERGRITKMKINRMELTDNGSEVLIDIIERLKRSVSKKNNEQNSSFENLAKLIERKKKKDD